MPSDQGKQCIGNLDSRKQDLSMSVASSLAYFDIAARLTHCSSEESLGLNMR